jgi:hypothetical protein
VTDFKRVAVIRERNGLLGRYMRDLQCRGVVVKQPANLENGRAEEEVDGEHVIWWCSRRTGNGSYDGVKPDKGNEEEKCTG